MADHDFLQGECAVCHSQCGGWLEGVTVRIEGAELVTTSDGVVGLPVLVDGVGRSVVPPDQLRKIRMPRLLGNGVVESIEVPGEEV